MILDLAILGTPTRVYWDKLSCTSTDHPAKEQLHDFYDGLFFAEYATGWKCDIGWFPEGPGEGTFVISLLDDQAMEWAPKKVFECEGFGELVRCLPTVREILAVPKERD
jgi:hypothetical protein